MHSLINFLGAVTARMIGLTALIPTTALINLVIARAQVPNSSTPQSVTFAILVCLGFSLAMVFLSPKATQRWLRKRRTIFGQLVFAIISIILVAEILIAAPTFIRFIDPRLVALTGPLFLLNIVLAVAFILLFLLPGGYARMLAQRNDPQKIAGSQPSEPTDQTWGEAFADVARATLARLIGFAVVLHPIVVLYLHINGHPRPPLSPTGDVTAVLALIIAVIFLVPAATQKVFEPAENWVARVVFGSAAIMVLSLVLAISAISLSELASETGREIYRDLLLSLFESLMISFIFSSIYSSFYTASPQERRARRMMMASTIPAHSNSPGSPGDIEPTSDAVGDLQSRLQSYENRRGQTQRTFQPATSRLEPAPRQPFIIVAINRLCLCLLFAVLILAFYGWREAQFVPTTETKALAGELHIPLLIVVCIFAIVMAVTVDENHPKVVKSMPVRCAAGIALFGGTALLGSQAFLTKGLPGLHSLFVEAPASEITVEITRIGNGRVRRGCDYTVYVRSDEYAGPDGVMICDVDRGLWGTLHPRDRITLRGYNTPYGFHYDSVTR